MAVNEAASTELYPELRGYAEDFGEAKAALHEVVNGLTDDDFNWRPEADSWSMAECYDHLCMLGNLIVPRIDGAIAAAEERGWRSDGPFTYGWLGNYFIKLAGPNSKRKFKAPSAVTPTSKHSISRVVKAFDELQDALIERTERANGVDLAKVKIRNPALPVLRLSLGQWFALLSGHQKRHHQQAQHVKETMMTQRGVTE